MPIRWFTWAMWLHLFEMINREGLPSNVKNDLCLQVQEVVVTTVQQVIEAALEEALRAYLGWERDEHLPWGRPEELTRKGSDRRELITQYGPIADWRVPKLRRGNGDLNGPSLTRYERGWGPLLDQQVRGYWLGLSLRDLQETMALTLGEVLSLSACNRIGASVTARVEAFKSQPLESPPPVIMVDGKRIKIAYPSEAIQADALGHRRYAKRHHQRVMLRALGVGPDGHGEIVHGPMAQGETADSWQAFLKALQSQGIARETTQLLVSEGATGLESALDHSLLGVQHPRCLVHKIKNLGNYLVFHDLEMAEVHRLFGAIGGRRIDETHRVCRSASGARGQGSGARVRGPLVTQKSNCTGGHVMPRRITQTNSSTTISSKN